MGLNYLELDAETRQYMLQELDSDEAEGRLVLNSHLSERGRRDYPELLRQAIQDPNGSDVTLARALAAHRRMSSFQPRHMHSRKLGLAAVASDANEVLAEQEFNRYYMRAVCLRAIAAGEPLVQVYRARPAISQRGRSTHLEDRAIPAERLLDDLRRNQGRETEIGLGKARSGLSVRLPAPSPEVAEWAAEFPEPLPA